MTLSNRLTLFCILAAPSMVHAQSNFQQLLPPTTAAVVQIHEPGEIVQQLLTHPVVETAYEAGLYDAALQDAQWAQIETLQTKVQEITGLPWEEALTKATSGGVHLAFDPPTDGVVVAIRGEEEVLNQFFEAVMSILEPIALLSGNPVKKGEYRDGIIGYQIQDIRFAKKEDTLVITNSRDLGRFVLDQLIDPATHPSFSSNEVYQEAISESKPTDHSAWLWIDAKLLEQFQTVDNFEQAMRSNMLLELLVGGISSQLAHTRYVTAAVDFNHQHLQLAVTTGYRDKWVSDSRRYFFGETSQAGSPDLLLPPDTIASISLFRDFSPWWLLAPDLYNSDVNESIAQADTTLSTFFSGKDFGTDILGSLEPGALLVVTDTHFAPDAPKPEIVFPSFAIVGHLQDAETMQPELRRMFINFTGFLNVVSAMEGNPQLDIDLVDTKNSRMITTSFIPPQPGQPISIQYNFTPTILFEGEKIILSSNRHLAEQLVEENPTSSKRGKRGWKTNTHFTLLARPLAVILRKNREILITNNMLDNGNARAEAEQEIDLILKGIEWVKSLDIKMEHSDKQLNLSFDLQFLEQDKVESP